MDADEIKALMRASLTKAQFRIEGDPEGHYRSVDRPDSAEVRAYILVKHAGRRPVIFNRVTKTWDAITAAKAAA